MSRLKAQKDECFILIKAQPHRSSAYFETVCCAGIGRDGKWKRQYPVPFRILDPAQKFNRWESITYEYTTSPKDPRRESQKVVPESIKPGTRLKKSERSKLLNPLVRASFQEADDRKESLCLIRPKSLELEAIRKSQAEIDEERLKHKELADQLSMFDNTAKPLEPSPIHFRIHWYDQDNKIRHHDCDDWETYAAFKRFSREYGDKEAVEILKDKYENEYFSKGLTFAFSTHSRRNIEFGMRNQWLMVGFLRLDRDTQGDLFLS